MFRSLIACFLLLFTACVDEADTTAGQDSVAHDSSAVHRNSLFDSVYSTVGPAILPFAADVAFFDGMPGAIAMDEKTAGGFFPGDFEYDAYTGVNCVASSTFADGFSGLWFLLTTKPELEDMDDGKNIYLVLYDSLGTPTDVYIAAYDGIGSKFSEVSSDTIKSIERDEMENIHLNCSAFVIRNGGFVQFDATSKTFPPDDNGAAESRNFIYEYINYR